MQRLFQSRYPRSPPNSNSASPANNRLTRPEDEYHENESNRRITHSESSRAVVQLASRTLTLASASLQPNSANNALSVIPRTSLSTSNSMNLNPNVGPRQQVYYRARTQPASSITPREMYWASRAIHSETLLAATTHHHHEVKELMRSRADEIISIKQQHDSRRAKVEWLIVFLAIAMILFAVFAIHRFMYPPQKSRGWINFTFPNHFTIPVLSPFASVVETESSLFTDRVMMLGLIVAGVLAYGLIRHRMNMMHEKPQGK